MSVVSVDIVEEALVGEGGTVAGDVGLLDGCRGWGSVFIGVVGVIVCEVDKDKSVEVDWEEEPEGEVVWSLKTVYRSPAIPNSCNLKETS